MSNGKIQKVRRNNRPRLVFPSNFFRALAAYCVLYNRPEHSRLLKAVCAMTPYDSSFAKLNPISILIYSESFIAIHS